MVHSEFVAQDGVLFIVHARPQYYVYLLTYLLTYSRRAEP